VKSLDEINARFLSSPLLSILDVRVKNEAESSELLRQITKTPNKLQLLRVYTPPWTSVGRWRLEEFEKLVEAFPGLEDLSIDIGLESGKWVCFKKPTCSINDKRIVMSNEK
jgi:hypothetical protein